MAVELGRARRWEHEQRQAALLAGELEFGGEIAAATLQGAKSLAETLWARSLGPASGIKKNAKNAQRGRNKRGIILLQSTWSCLLPPRSY